MHIVERLPRGRCWLSFAARVLRRGGLVGLALPLLAFSARAEVRAVPLLDGEPVAAPAEIFPVPPEMAPAVRFWTNLFLRYDSGQMVLHDRENMDIIWHVIDLPRDDDGAVDELQARQLVRRLTENLRRRLLRLENDAQPLDDEDRILLSLIGGPDSPSIEGAWQRVRSQRGVSDHFNQGLSRARIWFTEIQRILAEENVPLEIAALPFVESMFNPNARSSAGAVGLWQLMPATARLYGLQVGGKVDERLEVQKCTRGAARMLRHNYRLLGSWPLAITAYNHGPNGVRRAVAAVGSTDLVYLIENYETSSWGFASKNFYAEFLAAMRVFANLEAGFAALVRSESDLRTTQELQ